MFVLDTDHMSLLEWDNAGAFLLRERLAECDPDEVGRIDGCEAIWRTTRESRSWISMRVQPCGIRLCVVRGFESAPWTSKLRQSHWRLMQHCSRATWLISKEFRD
jgi:hypothetical protein